MYLLSHSYSLLVLKLKSLRDQRFKPRFDEDENQRLDTEIETIITSLTTVRRFNVKVFIDD